MDSRAFYSRIDNLGTLLRAEGMAYGVDVWLSVARLLERLERQGRLPNDASDLAPLLGPLFCRNPQDQARFPLLFEQWLKGESESALATENRISSPGRSAFVAAQEAAQKTQKIWIMGGIALIVCVIAVLLVKGPDWFLPKPPPPPTIKIPEKPSQPIPRRKPQPATASVAIVDHIAPRPQPEPDYVGLEWESIVRNIGWALFALPWLPVLLILAWRYQRNAVLRKQTASVDDLLHHFRFDRILCNPFLAVPRLSRHCANCTQRGWYRRIACISPPPSKPPRAAAVISSRCTAIAVSLPNTCYWCAASIATTSKRHWRKNWRSALKHSDCQSTPIAFATIRAGWCAGMTTTAKQATTNCSNWWFGTKPHVC